MTARVCRDSPWTARLPRSRVPPPRLWARAAALRQRDKLLCWRSACRSISTRLDPPRDMPWTRSWSPSGRTDSTTHRFCEQLFGQGLGQLLATTKHLQRLSACPTCGEQQSKGRGRRLDHGRLPAIQKLPQPLSVGCRFATADDHPHPVTNGKYSSSPAMSKEIVVTASTTSLAVKPGHRIIEYRKLTNPRCSISTPLGVPLEPEVYIQ